MSYSKQDIERHSLHIGGYRFPAVNVKAYTWGYNAIDLREDEPALTQEQADTIITMAFDTHSESFWETDVPIALEEYFGRGIPFSQGGRSNGWCIVTGLPDVESWDAVMVGKWHGLETNLRNQVKYLCERETIKGTIEANDWVGIELEGGLVEVQ